MNRREFVAVGAGGGALLVAGLGAVLGDGRLDDGPAYGAVATPPSSGTITLDNGLEASLYADDTVALFGASLTVDIEGGTAIAGRLRNVSEEPLAEVRLRVEFLGEGEAVLAQGWVAERSLSAGADWEFVVSYPGDDPDRIAAAAIDEIDAY